MEPSLIINNKFSIVNPVDGAPSPRRVTVDKVATFGVILGSGLLLFSLAALSVTAVAISASLTGLSILLKHVIKKIDDIVEEEGVRGTRLSIAALKGETIKARLLLALGANPNETDGGSCSPALNRAIEGAKDLAHVRLVLDLLHAGAEVDRPDPTSTADYTPLTYALMSEEPIATNRIAIELLRHGADANSPADPFKTHLYKAALLGNTELTLALLEQGAAIDAPGKEDGATPLFGAIENGYDHIVELLLAQGADKTLLKEGGQTPLEFATHLRSEMSGDDERRPRIERIIELLTV